MSETSHVVLIDVPERVETNRLVLRAPRAGDGIEINAAAIESLDALRPWMPWVHPAPSVEDTEVWVRTSVAKFAAREALNYLAFEKGTGRFVSTLGFPRLDWSVRSFEIGYWVRTSCEGRGYVTEAVATLTSMAFEHLKARRVEIRMDDRNERSARVAERLDFTLEGILRNDSLAPDGSIRSTRVYAKTS